MAEIGAAVDGVAGIVFEDAPLFTKNDAGDESFLFAAKEGGAQSAAEGTAFSGRTVTMNNLHGEDAGLLGLAEFGEQETAGLIDSGEAGLDVKSFAGGHEWQGNCDRGEGGNGRKCVGRLKKKSGIAQAGVEGEGKR